MADELLPLGDPSGAGAFVAGDVTRAPPAPPPEPKPLASHVAAAEGQEENPFAARLAKKPELAEPSLAERLELNAADAFYRGTLLGSGRLADLKSAAEGSFDPSGDPSRDVLRENAAAGLFQRPVKLPEVRALAAQELDDITRKLARYDAMRGFDGVGEGAAALTGQLGGSVFSPESLINRIPGVSTLLGRMASGVAGRALSAGVSQGLVNVATDPVVQAQSVRSEVQKEFDPIRTALAFPLGVAIGGGLSAAGDAAKAVAGKVKGKAAEPSVDPAAGVREAAARAEAERLAIAAEDPSARAAGDEAAIAATVEAQAKADAAATQPAPEQAPPLPQENLAPADPQGRVDISDHPVGAEKLTPPDASPTPALDAVGNDVARVADEIVAALPPEAKAEIGNVVDEIARAVEPEATPDVRAPGPGEAPAFVERGGQRFVAGVNGSDELGRITAEVSAAIGRESAPIRLAEGNHDPVSGQGYGLVHIEARHGGDIRGAGYPTVPDFVHDVASGFGEVYAGTRPGALLLAKRNGRAQVAIVELSPDGSGGAHWSVTTAALYRSDYFKPEKLLWRRSGPTDSPSDGSPFDPGGQSGPNIIGPGSEGESAHPRSDDGLLFRKGLVNRPTQPSAQAGQGAATDPVLTLQEQSLALADALGLPLRQGRLQGGKTTLGQYSPQDVARVRNVPDFETVSHEAGHALEKRVADLPALIQQHAAELGPLDYDPTKGRPQEGFAEFVRMLLTAPAAAQKAAPTFAAAFRQHAAAKAPDILAALDAAQAAHAAWINAPAGARIDAMVKRQEPDGLWRTLKDEGMARTVSLYVGRAYEAIFDDKAPVTRAVRDLARAIRDASGVRPSLEGADNPENLVRLFARAHQAGTRDMLDGVRPYRQIAPEGPSLRQALITATGNPGIFGRWDDKAMKAFSNYLVARRAEVLWKRYDAGLLPNRPIAMSKPDVATTIAELEAAYPGFRAGADQVHGYTRQLLRKQFESGLMDRELYDRLLQEEFYVPLLRDMRDKPLAGGDPNAGTARSEGPGKVELVKRIKGSDRDVIDPVQSLMTQTFLVNRTVAHNDIIKSFVSLARQARKAGATGAGRIVEEIPAHQIIGKRFDLVETLEAAARQHGIDPMDTMVLSMALTDVFGQDPIMGTIFRAEPAGKRGEPVVFYRDGGQLRAARFISKDEGVALYEALAELPPQMRDVAVQLGAAATTVFRAGITTNPVYALTNFVRDQLAAAVLRKDYIPFDPRGIGSEVFQTNAAQLYGYAGGVSPGAGQAGLHEMIDQSVEALARKGWAVQKLGGLADVFRKGDLKAGLKAVGEAVSTAEAATRLNIMRTVFNQKRRQGLSEYDAMIEAAAQATDILDFGRHGSGTDAIRALVPFINAHLQGLSKGYRTLLHPLLRAARGDMVTTQDVEALKNAGWGLTKMVGVGGSLGVAYGLWASKFDAYQDANDELRATHMVLPGEAFGWPGKILVVPKPFELAMGFNLGELIGQHVGTGDPRTAGFALAGLQEVLIPPNVLNSIPVVKTYAELTLGKSFFTKRDIVPGELQKLPPAEQYHERTSQLAKLVGKALDVSPIKVDYAIGATFGLWGRDLLAASNTADPTAPATALEDQMFFRRFIKSASAGSETTRKFWEQAAAQNGEFAKAKTAYERMLGQFRDADAAAFLAALPAPQRAYVTLASAANEEGKLAFTADDRRLHPLSRAATAAYAVNGLVKELQADAQKALGEGERIPLNPTQRRQIIDHLRVLSAMEQRNALVIAGEAGYKGRPLISPDDQLAVIRAISPKIAAEVATRYAQAKVYRLDLIAKAWPEAEKLLIREGGNADLSDIRGDVVEGGYQFGGQGVGRVHKRRVTIPPPLSPSPPTPR